MRWHHNGTSDYHYNPDWNDILDSSKVGRVVVTAVLSFCLMILGVCLGTRFKYHFMEVNLVRGLTLAVYWANACFIFAIDIVLTVTAPDVNAACLSTVIVCIALYAFTKVAAYTVFIARARPFATKNPGKDYKFLSAVAFVTIGYTAICAAAFLRPKTLFETFSNGHCRIGLPVYLVIAVFSFDLFMSIAICIGFFLYLHYHLKNRPHLFTPRPLGCPSMRAIRAALPFTKRDPQFYRPAAQPEYYAAKTLLASFILMLGVIGNLTALIALKGSEQPWLCICTCTFDSTIACMAVHYVTSKGPYSKTLRSLREMPQIAVMVDATQVFTGVAAFCRESSAPLNARR